MQAGIFQNITEKEATRRGRAIYNTYTYLNMKGIEKLPMKTSTLMYQRNLETEGLGQR